MTYGNFITPWLKAFAHPLWRILTHQMTLQLEYLSLIIVSPGDEDGEDGEDDDSESLWRWLRWKMMTLITVRPEHPLWRMLVASPYDIVATILYHEDDDEDDEDDKIESQWWEKRWLWEHFICCVAAIWQLCVHYSALVGIWDIFLEQTNLCQQ